MRIALLCIGKTFPEYLREGVSMYEKRIVRYCPFSLKILPEIKKSSTLSEIEIKNKEGKLFLSELSNSDKAIMFDDKGKQYSSTGFSEYINRKMVSGTKSLVFIVGGAYGFSDEMHERVDEKISLSPMTFSHQMVRLIAVEQLYRSFAILRGEPYHHE